MDDILGFVVTLIITLLLIGSIMNTLRLYNEYDLHNKIIAEVEQVNSIVDSGLVEKKGNVFIFKKGDLDIAGGKVKVSDYTMKLKHIKVSYDTIKKVDFKNTGHNKTLDANKLYGIEIEFKVKKESFRRLKVVYENE